MKDIECELVPWDWNDRLLFACALCSLKDVSQRQLVQHLIISHPYKNPDNSADAYRHNTHLVWRGCHFIELYCSKCIAKFSDTIKVRPCLNDAPVVLKLMRIARKHVYALSDCIDSKIKQLSIPYGYKAP